MVLLTDLIPNKFFGGSAFVSLAYRGKWASVKSTMETSGAGIIDELLIRIEAFDDRKRRAAYAFVVIVYYIYTTNISALSTCVYCRVQRWRMLPFVPSIGFTTRPRCKTSSGITFVHFLTEGSKIC